MMAFKAHLDNLGYSFISRSLINFFFKDLFSKRGDICRPCVLGCEHMFWVGERHSAHYLAKADRQNRQYSVQYAGQLEVTHITVGNAKWEYSHFVEIFVSS